MSITVRFRGRRVFRFASRVLPTPWGALEAGVGAGQLRGGRLTRRMLVWALVRPCVLDLYIRGAVLGHEYREPVLPPPADDGTGRHLRLVK